MFKLISTFLLVLAVAKGWEDQELATTFSNSDYGYDYQTENYISLHKQQFEKNIQEFDEKLEYYKKHYTKSIELIQERSEMVTQQIKRTNDYLYPLGVLNDYNRQCVDTHSKYIPTITFVETESKKCHMGDDEQLLSLYKPLEDIRNDLDTYYKTAFENYLKSCPGKGYFKCISDAIENANNKTITSKKEFGYKWDAAECTAKANIKRVTDCSYTFVRNAFLGISKAKHLVSECLTLKDECKPCIHHCPTHIELTPADPADKTVLNPYHGNSSHGECLLVNLQEKPALFAH